MRKNLTETNRLNNRSGASDLPLLLFLLFSIYLSLFLEIWNFSPELVTTDQLSGFFPFVFLIYLVLVI